MIDGAGGALGFATAGSERMRIDSSGNVGIGTSSPSGKLDVTGSNGKFYVAATGNEAYFSFNSGNYFRANGGSSAFLDIGGQSYLRFTTGSGFTEAMRIDSSGNLRFNSGYGSVATAYGCRAWVNFNGTGTVAIRASANVSSVTDLGTGQYRVNFTNAMPDANYAPAISWSYGEFTVTTSSTAGNTDTPSQTTTSCNLTTGRYGSAGVDMQVITLSIFR